MRVAFLLLLFLVTPILGCLEREAGEVNETEILSIAGIRNGNVEKLTPERIAELSEKYPVIYGNLPNKTLYQIKTEDMLIVVDADEKKVLRAFRVVGLEVGG